MAPYFADEGRLLLVGREAWVGGEPSPGFVELPLDVDGVLGAEGRGRLCGPDTVDLAPGDDEDASDGRDTRAALEILPMDKLRETAYLPEAGRGAAR